MLSKGADMEEYMQVELYKMDDKRNIFIITINELSEELKIQIDKYICRIWAGQNEYDIKHVKKEILEYISTKDRKKQIGAIAEFFIHLFLNYKGYTPYCLFQNLEENSLKKGFDGYFSLNNEEWIVESKSTKDRSVKHHTKVSEAYNDLNSKITGKTSNNPWKNAYNHSCNINILAPENVRKQLDILSKEFVDKKFHKLSEYNIIPCSTKFIEEKDIEKSDVVHNTVLEKVNSFEFNKITVICINNGAEELFMEYLRS